MPYCHIHALHHQQFPFLLCASLISQSVTYIDSYRPTSHPCRHHSQQRNFRCIGITTYGLVFSNNLSHLSKAIQSRQSEISRSIHRPFTSILSCSPNLCSNSLSVDTAVTSPYNGDNLINNISRLFLVCSSQPLHCLEHSLRQLHWLQFSHYCQS